MVIATQAMIPLDPAPYPVLSVRPEDSPQISEDTVERRYPFQRPPSGKITTADPASNCCNRYDNNQRWQYADDYRVGERIDVYA